MFWVDEGVWPLYGFPLRPSHQQIEVDDEALSFDQKPLLGRGKKETPASGTKWFLLTIAAFVGWRFLVKPVTKSSAEMKIDKEEFDLNEANRTKSSLLKKAAKEHQQPRNMPSRGLVRVRRAKKVKKEKEKIIFDEIHEEPEARNEVPKGISCYLGQGSGKSVPLISRPEDHYVYYLKRRNQKIKENNKPLKFAESSESIKSDEAGIKIPSSRINDGFQSIERTYAFQTRISLPSELKDESVSVIEQDEKVSISRPSELKDESVSVIEQDEKVSRLDQLAEDLVKHFKLQTVFQNSILEDPFMEEFIDVLNDITGNNGKLSIVCSGIKKNMFVPHTVVPTFCSISGMPFAFYKGKYLHGMTPGGVDATMWHIGENYLLAEHLPELNGWSIHIDKILKAQDGVVDEKEGNLETLTQKISTAMSNDAHFSDKKEALERKLKNSTEFDKFLTSRGLETSETLRLVWLLNQEFLDSYSETFTFGPFNVVRDGTRYWFCPKAQ